MAISWTSLFLFNFLHVWKHIKMPLEVYFIFLGNKDICCIFKTCCIIYVLFSEKCYLFRNFFFLCSSNAFYINHVLKFKYEPVHLKVNTCPFHCSKEVSKDYRTSFSEVSVVVMRFHFDCNSSSSCLQ
jgi:hypothetical protein